MDARKPASQTNSIHEVTDWEWVTPQIFERITFCNRHGERVISSRFALAMSDGSDYERYVEQHGLRHDSMLMIRIESNLFLATSETLAIAGSGRKRQYPENASALKADIETLSMTSPVCIGMTKNRYYWMVRKNIYEAKPRFEEDDVLGAVRGGSVQRKEVEVRAQVVGNKILTGIGFAIVILLGGYVFAAVALAFLIIAIPTLLFGGLVTMFLKGLREV